MLNFDKMYTARPLIIPQAWICRYENNVFLPSYINVIGTRFRYMRKAEIQRYLPSLCRDIRRAYLRTVDSNL